jgi:hypothetical protein
MYREGAQGLLQALGAFTNHRRELHEIIDVIREIMLVSAVFI